MENMLVLLLVALLGVGIYYLDARIIRKETDIPYQDLVKVFIYTMGLGYLITLFMDGGETTNIQSSTTGEVKEILTGQPPF